MNDVLPIAQAMPAVHSRKRQSAFRRVQHTFLHGNNNDVVDESHRFTSEKKILRSARGTYATLQDATRSDAYPDDLSTASIEVPALLPKRPLEQTSLSDTVVTVSTSASSYWGDEENVAPATRGGIKTVRFSSEPPEVGYTSSPRITSKSSDAAQRHKIWYSSHQVQEMDNLAHCDLTCAKARCPNLGLELWDLFRDCQELDLYDTDDQFELAQEYYQFLTFDVDDTTTTRGMERHVHPNMRKHRHYHIKAILQLQEQLLGAKVSLNIVNRCNFLRSKSLESSQGSGVMARVLGIVDELACADHVHADQIE
jgi:hypothetical protein